MPVIVGYIIVIGSVLGGYALAGGHLAALMQPLELLMIGGAAAGAFVVGNPAKVLKATAAALPTVVKGSKYTKARYLALMALMFGILTKIRKEGMISIEKDVDKPEESPYERALRRVRLATGQNIDAWVYLYRKSVRLRPELKGGRWTPQA